VAKGEVGFGLVRGWIGSIEVGRPCMFIVFYPVIGLDVFLCSGIDSVQYHSPILNTIIIGLLFTNLSNTK
jgi:hypothetical protein